MLHNPESPGHFFVEKSFPRAIGLHPLAIDDELWDGPLPCLADYFVGSAGRGLNINFAVRNAVFVEEALRLSTIRTPKG